MLDYRNCFIMSAVNSTTPRQVFPEYEVVEENQINKHQGYSLAGNHNVHRVKGNNYKYTIPFTYINSSDKFYLESFWENREEIVVTFANSTSNPWGVVGKIINIERPFSQLDRMQSDRWKGFIRISQTTGNVRFDQGNPFILDDTIYGKLDENILI